MQQKMMSEEEEENLNESTVNRVEAVDMVLEDMQQEVVGKWVEDKVNEMWVEDRADELRVAGMNGMRMVPDKVKKQDMVEMEGDMLMAEEGRQ